MSNSKEPQFTPETEEQLKRAIIQELLNKPPTIGLIGVSGTGKSSTINSMFKTNLEISHVVACTKEFKDTELKVTVSSGQAKGKDAVLRIIDAPGLGEDVRQDPRYLEMYKKNLSRCDVILWVLTARNRAIALDQMYLQKLPEFQNKIVFGINQVDLVEPLNWQGKINLPSHEQKSNIEIIVKDRKEKIEAILKRKIKIIPYSALHKYNLQELFTTLIESAPEHRLWIFSAIKAFSYSDFLPAEAKNKILQMLNDKH